MSQQNSFFRKAYNAVKRGMRKLARKEEDALKNHPKWFRVCYYIILYPLAWLLRKFLELLAWLFSKAVQYTFDAVEMTREELAEEKKKKEEK